MRGKSILWGSAGYMPRIAQDFKSSMCFRAEGASQLVEELATAFSLFSLHVNGDDSRYPAD